MSSFLCFVCHSTVNADTNEDTREKYREVIGMHLCPDSHLCFICCHFLNKMCLFKSICLKRSLEYPVLFSEKGTINLQRSDIAVSILCPEDICLQHLNTRYHFYNNSENSQSDLDESNYCELQDDRNFDVNDSLAKMDANDEFHSDDFLFSNKDNKDDSLFNEELCLPNLEPVRITQNDLVNGEWTNNDGIPKKGHDAVLLELDKCRKELNFEENISNIECTDIQKIQAKLDDHLNLNIDNNVYENIPLLSENDNENVGNIDNENVENNNHENSVLNKENRITENVGQVNKENVENNSNENGIAIIDIKEESSRINEHLENDINENIENNKNTENNITLDVKEVTTVDINLINPLEVEDTNLEDNNLTESIKKSRRFKKKDFEKIKLTIKEQKTELQQARRDEKYIEASFKCYNCALHFHFKDSYQAHMMRHEESNGEYRCSICSLRFANPAVLRSHAANHAERYQCKRCREVVRPRQRQTHLRVCRGKGMYSIACHLCGNEFQGSSHFQQHLKRFHQSKSSNRSFLCNVCGASYNNRAAVRTHMITHINRKFTCDQCSSTFSSPYTLNQHKKIHLNVERDLHFCSTCKIGYTTRKSLLAHRRNSLAHKDSVYKCAICERTCPSLRSLRAHTATVHDRSNHLVCALCPARYSTRKALVRHMARHKTDLPKQTPLCHACGETFKSSSILKRHLKNVCEKDRIEELLSYYQ